MGYGDNRMAARNHLARRSPDAARGAPGRHPRFFAQPAEHHGPLGITPIGLISMGSIFGTGRIFPLALNFFGAFYHVVH
jgi:hypothetical protein